MVQFGDVSWSELLDFLSGVERAGTRIPATLWGVSGTSACTAGGTSMPSASGACSASAAAIDGATVGTEARLLRAVFLRLQDSCW